MVLQLASALVWQMMKCDTSGIGITIGIEFFLFFCLMAVFLSNRLLIFESKVKYWPKTQLNTPLYEFGLVLGMQSNIIFDSLSSLLSENWLLI